MQDIHNAKFKKLPANYKKLSKEEITQVNQHGHLSDLMPKQEKGTRSACPIPYELYVNGNVDKQQDKVLISFKAGKELFGEHASGCPFYTYSIHPYQQQEWQTRDYAVRAGFEEKDEWDLQGFENGHYRLRVYGPNGFYREFAGDKQEPAVNIACNYEWSKTGSKQLTGNISLVIVNSESKPVTVSITDNSYKAGVQKKTIPAGTTTTIVLNQSTSYGWYDFSVSIPGNIAFEKRFAGHVETGAVSKTDPLMGQVI